MDLAPTYRRPFPTWRMASTTAGPVRRLRAAAQPPLPSQAGWATTARQRKGASPQQEPQPDTPQTHNEVIGAPPGTRLARTSRAPSRKARRRVPRPLTLRFRYLMLASGRRRSPPRSTSFGGGLVLLRYAGRDPAAGADRDAAFFGSTPGPRRC